MFGTKRVLIDRITQERSAVFYAIAFMPEDSLTKRGVVGEWSVKDVLGHMAAWDAEIMHSIEQFLRGERPSLLDIASLDAWNGKQSVLRRDRSLSDVQTELVETRARLLELLAKLPDEAFARLGPPPSTRPFVSRMLNVIAEHDRTHWARLAAYKAEWVAGQQVQVQSVTDAVMAPAAGGSRPPLLTR